MYETRCRHSRRKVTVIVELCAGLPHTVEPYFCQRSSTLVNTSVNRILFCLNKTAFFIAQTNFFDRKNAFYDHESPVVLERHIFLQRKVDRA